MHKELKLHQQYFFLNFKNQHVFQYTTNFSKLSCTKPTSQLSRSKYRISVRGPALLNEFLTDSEKKISLFKSKVKSKLLSYENEVIFLM